MFGCAGKLRPERVLPLRRPELRSASTTVGTLGRQKYRPTANRLSKLVAAVKSDDAPGEVKILHPVEPGLLHQLF